MAQVETVEYVYFGSQCSQEYASLLYSGMVVAQLRTSDVTTTRFDFGGFS